MNIDLLRNECIKATKNAFSDYKHYIENALFDVDDSIIQLHVNEMKQNAGKKVNSYYAKNANYSKPQHDYVKELLDSYLRIAVDRAYKFGNRYKKRSTSLKPQKKSSQNNSQ